MSACTIAPLFKYLCNTVVSMIACIVSRFAVVSILVYESKLISGIG